MATNIELKACCANLTQARIAAGAQQATSQPLLNQKDTYFRTSAGRLKLREINGERAELIHYHRANDPKIRKSEYTILDLSPQQGRILVDQLAASIGILVVVAKRRELWMWNDVRIHLDEVEGLGSFIEFEGLVGPNCTEAEAAEKVATLTKALGIADADRISTSYSDLLLSRQS